MSFVFLPIAIFANCRKRGLRRMKSPPNPGSRCVRTTFSPKNFCNFFLSQSRPWPRFLSITARFLGPISGAPFSGKFEQAKFQKCFLTKQSGGWRRTKHFRSGRAKNLLALPPTGRFHRECARRGSNAQPTAPEAEYNTR